MAGIITSISFQTTLASAPDLADLMILYRTLRVPLRTWGVSRAALGGMFGTRFALAAAGGHYASRTALAAAGGHYASRTALAALGGHLPPERRATPPVGGRSHATVDDARRWSLKFDGQNDYVSFGDVPTGLSALTVEGWFKLGDNERKNALIVKDDPASDRAWYLIVSEGTIYWLAKNSLGTSKEASSSWATPPHTWVYVAGVFDGSRLRLFVDGVLAGSSGMMAAPLASPAALAVEAGRQGPASPLDGYFDGHVAYLRISAVARYGGTFTPPTAPHAVDGDVLAQWDFTEGSGTALDNAQGNAAYDGVISGAAWSRDVPPGWG